MSQVHNLQDAAGVIATLDNGDIILAVGTSAPTGAGYAPGCLFIVRSGASAGAELYKNEGSSTSADFNKVPSIDIAQTFAGSNTFSGTNTHSGTNTFSGSVAFTGTQIETSVLTPTSTNHSSRHRYTISASRDAGKTIVFTSGNNTSRHTWVMLPFASTLTGGGSGMVIRFINDRTVNTSGGITIMTSAAAGRRLNGNSRPLRATSRIVRGSITITKVNNKWYTLNRDTGTNGSVLALNSLVWLTV